MPERRRRPGPTPNPQSARIKAMLKRAFWPAVAVTVMGFFGLYAVTGPTGMLAYGDYKQQLAKQEAEYKRLDRERAVMKNRVELLDPKKADPDMVDELVRKELNVARPDEVVVKLDK